MCYPVGMTHRPPLFIGIDGGGTGCRVAIADAQGVRIGEATGGAANYTTNSALALQNVLAAVDRAAAAAGITQDQVRSASVHLGLAGIIGQQDLEAVRARLPFTRCRISDDQITSVTGALADRNGAVIAVGTGSFLAVKRGHTIRTIGGWGLQLGDQASGAWLGRTILQRCALVRDGLAEPSELVQRIWAKFDDDASRLIDFARTASPSDHARLASEVLAGADAGDANALTILSEAADYLNTGLSSLDLGDDDVVCLTGGLGPFYRPRLDPSFQERLAEPLGTALDGAVQLARDIEH